MSKEEIIQKLRENHERFTLLVTALDERSFLFTTADKWTAGQQAEHILRSIKPVLFAFRLPLFSLKLLFGKANRPSRSYIGLVDRYHEKIAVGGSASGRFIPPVVPYDQKKDLCVNITSKIAKLCVKINNTKEEDMDTYILPHPLLGKVTLREMLYFTAYHVHHHQMNIEALVSAC